MSASHIPIEELTQQKTLLDRARAGGAVVIDGDGETFQILRFPTRPLREILEDQSIAWSNVTLDDEFGRDLEAIRAQNRLPDKDP